MKMFNELSPKTDKPQVVFNTKRYRTIRECYAELKRIDENTAVSEYYIRQLCKQNKINYYANGTKSLLDLDDLLRYLGFIEIRDNQNSQIKENNSYVY